MFKARNSFIAFILLYIFIASLCPLLATNQFGEIQTFNLYQIDLRLFFINTAFIAIIAFTLFNANYKKFKFLSVFFMLWLLLIGYMIYNKSTLSMQFNFAERFANSQVQLHWGAYLILLGVLLLNLCKIPKQN